MDFVGAAFRIASTLFIIFLGCGAGIILSHYAFGWDIPIWAIVLGCLTYDLWVFFRWCRRRPAHQA